jgi:cytolysin-activating lysine-acyltransferase
MTNNVAPKVGTQLDPKAPDLPQQDIDRLTKMAKDHAHTVLKKIPVLGPVVWLMMSQAMTKHTLISELEWRVMPPLVLDQAKLYFRDEAPVAYVSWAKLSDAAVERYRCAPHQLAASDWNSGNNVWLIDVFTPFGGAQEVLKDLREVMFKGQAIHQLLPDTQEHAKVLTWPAL